MSHVYFVFCAASFVIPAGRTTAELGTSTFSVNFTFPGYAIHVPAGVTLQTASGQFYKVNVPLMVTQTSGRAGILQHPIQQVFQQLGQPSVLEACVPRLSPYSLQATTEKSQKMETMLQQPTILHSGTLAMKYLDSTTSVIHLPSQNEHKIMSEALLSQPENSQFITLSSVVFPPPVSPTNSNMEPVLSVSASMTQNLHGGPLSTGPQRTWLQHMSDIQLHVLKNRMLECDSEKQPRNKEEPRSLPVLEKDSNTQMDLSIQTTDDDTDEIIQVDGTGDTSSNDRIGSTRDVDENEFLGIIDARHLKVLEEKADSVSNEDSTANTSDNEDPHIDIVEEEALNSGDDVSEQDVPDLFDTDNVIVCQYDKIHRSKNKWKFYLKDGIMCFGGKDYVFAKAIGDAEW
nr:TFIIA-alpha and beta-like factor isoform X1 [Manis javanica]